MSTPIAWDDPFRVNATTLRKQFDPDLAGLANGGFIGAWTDNSKTGADGSGSAVRAQIIDAFGHRTGPEYLVNTSTKAAQTAPCVAALSNGRTVVLWQDAVDPVGKATGFIRGQIFNANGTKSGHEFVVHTSLKYIDKVTLSQESITYSLGDVVALPNGGFAVLSFRRWFNAFDFEISSRTAVIKFYSANGDEVASASSTVTSHLLDSGNAEMAVLQNGRVVLVSHTVNEIGEEHASLRIYSANGTSLLNANITPADTGVSRSLTQVCPLASNGFMVLWTESETFPDSAIVGQIYSNAGAAIGSEVQITAVPSEVYGIQAALLPDGSVVVVWLDDGNVMGQLLNADGSKSGDQFTIHGLGLANGATVSVLADGRFVVSWDQANLAHTDSEVFAQIYDARVAGIQLAGTAQNDSFVGTDFNDVILGFFGRDLISGGAGNDHLFGYEGDDRLYGLDGNDLIVGGDGRDLLRGSQGNDVLHGWTGNDTIEGGSGNDHLAGQAGDDILNGGSGNDTMSGSVGNDTYVVDSLDDVVTEFAGKGIDTVRTLVDHYSLDQHVENLRLLGTDNLVAIGNSRNNIIIGNDGDNNILGGLGKDILTGGRGRDGFLFEALAESGPGLARDVIKDFSEGIDRIYLDLIDAVRSTSADDAFVFIGAKSFSGLAGQLMISTVDLAGTASDKTIVAGDVDGNKVADFQIELSGLHKLDAEDFAL